MFTYKVIDDFVPPYHQECIAKQSEVLNWKHSENISGIRYDVDFSGMRLSENQEGYYYNAFSLEYKDRDELMIGLVLPLVFRAKSYIPEEVGMERIRLGKFLKGSPGIHRPHTDYFTDHYTLLYYVNDSDGDTVLFNEFAESSAPAYPSKFSVLDRVSPKKGRAVLFNGLIYHCSSTPEFSDERIAININLMVRS